MTTAIDGRFRKSRHESAGVVRRCNVEANEQKTSEKKESKKSLNYSMSKSRGITEHNSGQCLSIVVEVLKTFIAFS